MSTERLRELLLGGLGGDSAAYGEFLSSLSGHLRAFFLRRLSGFPSDVEDLVQESLLAIHTKRYTYDERHPLGAWIHAIAKYKLVDFLRERGRRDALNDPMDDIGELFAESTEEAAEAHRDIMRLLDRLPDKQRLPIIHTKLQGLSVEEAARLSDMSESAIKVAVHRGLKALNAMVSKP